MSDEERSRVDVTNEVELGVGADGRGALGFWKKDRGER